MAGCPPDAFSEDGQLWGNPLFRWDVMKKDGYSWWTKRVAAMSKLYDIVRIDHFRGFDSYYLPRTADSQFYYGKKISMSQLRPGDLIFFTTYEPGASHCGIYIGNGNFIHAGTSTGVAVASAFTGYWGARYYGACRVLK